MPLFDSDSGGRQEMCGKRVGKWCAANDPASQDSKRGLAAQGICANVVCTRTIRLSGRSQMEIFFN